MNQVEIIQHGLTHNLSNGRGEFGENLDLSTFICLEGLKDNDLYDQRDISYQNQHNKRNIEVYLNIGRKILMKALNIYPRIFVPPYDDMSTENIDLISNIGMIPVYGQSIYHRFFRSNQIPTKLKSYLALKIIRKFMNKGFIIPLVMSNFDYFGTKPRNGIMLYLPRRLKVNPISDDDKEPIINKSKVFLKWVSNTVSHCKIYRNPICILNHYHHYFYDWHEDKITRNTLYAQWILILNLLNNIPFSWKTNFSELHQRINDIRKIKFAKTGDKITVQSDQQIITDISFKVDKKLELKNDKNTYRDPHDERIITIKRINPDSHEIFYLR
jgi:hypothetical protein